MAYELVIIGAGITGLKSALIAQKSGLKDVLIIDYEKQKGGFGSSLFDREEFGEEKKILEESDQLTYEIWTQSTAVGFFAGEEGGNHQISVQTPEGTKEIEAKKVLLCTGSLEKPREGNKIPGTRPAGVMTSQMAVGLLERDYKIGTKIAIYENSKLTEALAGLLEEKGAEVNRLNGEEVEITNIKGVSRICEIEVKNKSTGEKASYPCDTLIYSNGKIPCTFYLKGSEVELDDEQNIKVDEKGNTNIARVAAFGSCTNKTEKFDVFSAETENAIREFIQQQ
ncbi:FAD-dependent oxidoreductase [Aeribacillus pallidus]|uniref:FAD/NAD(P)-binding domain-containing protein n=1 Tax=Aeribacillus pallidus TaxID=33936 RepID=A0A223E302_9BACI|nr:FAD-dependent oxidoreductase [Aeribacillus pallidus]ASS89638.1 hypothetical protein AP3564_04640 [Aeribacillus pallidus]